MKKYFVFNFSYIFLYKVPDIAPAVDNPNSNNDDMEIQDFGSEDNDEEVLDEDDDLLDFSKESVPKNTCNLSDDFLDSLGDEIHEDGGNSILQINLRMVIMY